MDASQLSFIQFVQAYSPFYANLYKDIPVSPSTSLSDLPIVPPAGYWTANTSSTSTNTVRTSPLVDGVIFKTGGTTSKPKATAYSQAELQRTTNLLGAGLVAAGLRSGDCVANLFYAGEMWGSFLLHVLSIMSAPVPAIHLPISGPAEPESYAGLLEEYEATAILATPTTLVKLAQYLTTQGKTLPKVHAIMFGGEPLHPDQTVFLKKVFPNATSRSCILGSMDAGVYALSAADDADPRLHIVASPTAIVELVVDAEDPHSKVIEENGVAGDIVVTSLIRHLTPVVRYPAGDRAEWVDREKGLFRLLGRVQNSIRLGPVSLDATELRALASRTLHPSTVAAFQTVVKREDGKDSLLCRIALAEEEANGHNGADLSHATNGEASAEQRVLNALWEERPMLLQHVQMGMIRVEVEICEMRDMAVNKRSGKLMSVVQ